MLFTGTKIPKCPLMDDWMTKLARARTHTHTHTCAHTYRIISHKGQEISPPATTRTAPGHCAKRGKSDEEDKHHAISYTRNLQTSQNPRREQTGGRHGDGRGWEEWMKVVKG